MIVVGHGNEKFPTGRLIASSVHRHWSGILAELRSHPAGDLPTYVPVYTEVAILIRGRSTVTRQAGAMRQRTDATRGTIWLCPAGLREDFISISDDIDEVLHIYLSPSPFSALAKGTSRTFSAASLRYEAGFRDPLLEQIAQVIISEMRNETSCGRLLVETLADSIIARLLNGYSDLPFRPLDTVIDRKQLDHRRLRRALEFIEANLESDITMEDVASAASLSRFHFARAFKATTGKSPRSYISERRLSLAKLLLMQGDKPIMEIAFACNFSSQANFAKAFRRATGLTPGQYRNLIRGR